MYLFYIGLIFGTYYFGIGMIMMLYYLYNLYKNNTKENALKALFYTSLTCLGFTNTLFYILMNNLYNLLMDYDNTIKTIIKLKTHYKDEINYFIRKVTNSNVAITIKNKAALYNKYLYKLDFIIEQDYEYYINVINNTVDTQINKFIESNEYLKKIKDDIEANNNKKNELDNINQMMESMMKPLNQDLINTTPPSIEEMNNFLNTMNVNVLNSFQPPEVKLNRAQRRLAKKNK